jgi:hypothetical protein
MKRMFSNAENLSCTDMDLLRRMKYASIAPVVAPVAEPPVVFIVPDVTIEISVLDDCVAFVATAALGIIKGRVGGSWSFDKRGPDRHVTVNNPDQDGFLRGIIQKGLFIKDGDIMKGEIKGTVIFTIRDGEVIFDVQDTLDGLFHCLIPGIVIKDDKDETCTGRTAGQMTNGHECEYSIHRSLIRDVKPDSRGVLRKLDYLFNTKPGYYFD